MFAEVLCQWLPVLSLLGQSEISIHVLFLKVLEHAIKVVKMNGFIDGGREEVFPIL